MEVRDLIKRKNALKSDRANWENYWQDLADYILPRKNQVTNKTEKGSKRNLSIFDSTAIRANVRLAAGLHSTLTSPVTRFFDLTTGRANIDDQDKVRLFRQNTADNIWNVIQNSNFQTEIHEVYIDLGCFGTGPLFVEDDKKKVVNFTAYPIVDLIIGEGLDGIVNEVHREFKWTARQIMSKWGKDSKAVIPDEVERAFKSDPEKKFDLVHSIFPDEVRDNFKSNYLLDNGDGGKSAVIKTGFYHEFPWMVPRWAKDSSEMYGRSAGMETLPDIRTLNAVVKTDLKGRQKAIDPPLQAPDDGFLRRINLTPGAVNRKRNGSDSIEPIITGPRVDLSDSLIEKLRSDIREGFMNDLFTLMNVGDRATAREIDERVQQQLRTLSPILGRMHTELLRPLVDRVFGIMSRRGLITDIPEEIENNNLEAVFSSPLARAQKSQDANIVLQTFQMVAGIAQVDPNVFDNFDLDKASLFVAKSNGYPQDLLRAEDEIEGIRNGRAQAQEQQIESEQQNQQVDQVAKVAPAVAQMEQARNA